MLTTLAQPDAQPDREDVMTTLADHEPRVEIAAPRPQRLLVPLDRASSPSWYQRRGKRVFDVAVSLALIGVLASLMVAVAGMLRISLGPNVVLRQRRVGLHGHDFTMYKFRTMHPDRRRIEQSVDQPVRSDGPDRRRCHKSPDDPRHTRVGRVLRRSSLDELPQLFNVVRGDMSLVGPRPELAELVDARLLRAHPRHLSRPGITGPWQIGRRNEGALLCDCLDEVGAPPTLRDDLEILIATLGVMWRRSGR